MCKDTPVFLHWLIAVSSNTSWEKKNVFTVFSKHSLISPSELPCKQRIKPSKFRLSLIESTQGSNFLNCWWRVNTKHKHACLSVVLLMHSGYTNMIRILLLHNNQKVHAILPWNLWMSFNYIYYYPGWSPLENDSEFTTERSQHLYMNTIKLTELPPFPRLFCIFHFHQWDHTLVSETTEYHWYFFLETMSYIVTLTTVRTTK